MNQLTAYQAAEIIQNRFVKNDDDQVIACTNRYMSDLLGSDWGSGLGFDDYTAVDVFYCAVRKAATRKYGALPF